VALLSIKASLPAAPADRVASTAAFWSSAKRVQSAMSGRWRSLRKAAIDAIRVYAIDLASEVLIPTIF